MKTTIFALLMILLVAAVSAKEYVVSSSLSETMDVTADFGYSFSQMTGSVLQNDLPVNGATVTFSCQYWSIMPELCGPISTYVTSTDSNGNFEVKDMICDSGDYGWFVVSYNDVEYTGEMFPLNAPKSEETSDPVAHAPEFSLATMGITMIGAGLIFAFLRKR